MDASQPDSNIGQPDGRLGQPGNARPTNGPVTAGSVSGTTAESSSTASVSGLAATGWDYALAAALQDVPVPAGLSSRLLARLAEPAVAANRQPAVRRAVVRRRWLQVAAASLACAASVTVAILFFNQPTAEFGSESVMESVRAWHNHQPALLEPLRHEAPPEDYAPGSVVVPGYLVGWRALSSPLLGREGVAYQLIGPHQTRATLYVLDFDGPRSAPRVLLNTTSPLENMLTTDGQTSSTWTDGVRLYVLVADGNEHDFRALVRAPRSMA